jgi:hypothetical protein
MWRWMWRGEVRWDYFTTDGQSVSMSWYRAALWDLRPDITSCQNVAVRNLRSCFCGAPSLTRGLSMRVLPTMSMALTHIGVTAYVWPHQCSKLENRWTDFHEIWHLEILTKSVGKSEFHEGRCHLRAFEGKCALDGITSPTAPYCWNIRLKPGQHHTAWQWASLHINK